MKHAFGATKTTMLGIARWLGGTSLRRELMLVFLACGVAGGSMATYVWSEYEYLSAIARQIDGAGQLRMLSQRTLLQARAAATGAPGAAAELAATRIEFDRMLEAQYAFRLGARGDGDPRPLDHVAAHWRAMGHAIDELIDTGPQRGPGEAGTMAWRADDTLAAADANAQHLLRHFEQTRQRIDWLPPVTMIGGLVLVGAMYAYIRRRLLDPVAALDRMLTRLGEGDLGARVDVRRADEIGELLRRANHAAQALGLAQAQEAAALAQLRDSEVRNRTLWEIAADAIVVIDLEGTIRFANPSVRPVFGHAPEALVGRHVSVLQPPAARDAHRAGFGRHLETGGRRLDWRCVELVALHRDGREIDVELSFSRMRLSDADLFVGTFRDVTQRKQAQAQLHLTSRAVAATGEGIMITDARAPDHPVLYVNPAFVTMTGYPIESILGSSGRMFVDPAALSTPEAETLRWLLATGKAGTVTLRFRRSDGSTFWNELSVAPVMGANQEITHTITVSKDVTQRRLQEDALVRSATSDALTGLPNRVLLYDRIDQALAAARRAQRAFAVMYVDLDHFKIVNDSLGHETGDALLCEAAARLQRCLREVDTVARIGGDEFVVLLAEPGDGDADGVDAVAARMLAALGEPFVLDGSEAFVGASIGVALFPRDGETRAELLQHADIAMFRAKESGRNNVQQYADQMRRRYQQRLSLGSRLHKAVDNGELLLHYQPQVDLSTGRICGAEALVRWDSPGLGRVSPAEFVPIAEETGLIVPIGEWVMRRAGEDRRRWGTMPGGGDCRVSVNLSARQIVGNALPRVVEDILSRNRLDGDALELEITESLVMRNPKQASDILRELRALGCPVAIDDFGTGYSSLGYLRTLPLDCLKIDRSLIGDATIVQAVIHLARNFGLRTVAEGVEDRTAVHRLRRLGCDIAQGFYYAKPMPYDDFVAFLAATSEPRATGT